METVGHIASRRQTESPSFAAYTQGGPASRTGFDVESNTVRSRHVRVLDTRLMPSSASDLDIAATANNPRSAALVKSKRPVSDEVTKGLITKQGVSVR